MTVEGDGTAQEPPVAGPAGWPGAGATLQTLALVFAAVTVLIVVSSWIARWSQGDLVTQFSATQQSIVDVTLDWAAGLGAAPAVLLASAVALVATSGVGLLPAGRRASQIVVGVGILVCSAQSAAALDAVVGRDDAGPTGAATALTSGRPADAIPLVALAIVAALVAWCAFSLLEQDRGVGSAVGDVDDEA